MKYPKKILITISLLACLNSLSFIHAENVNNYEKDPYNQESLQYINELNIKNAKTSKTNITEKIYNDIYKALINLEDSIDLSKYGTPNSTEVFAIRKKVMDDHPEIFYLDYGNSVYWSDGKLEFKYIHKKSTLKNMIDELNNKVNNILNTYINTSMSDLEKVIAIHDYIVLNTEYLLTDYCYDTYGILVKGKGVCQGYAESMKLLLNKVGVDCIYVSSEEMNHGWNIVTIDGQNYHLDATWDDPVPNRDNVTKYEYLALSDEEISKTHTWNKNKYLSCNSNKYKYMREMDYVLNGNSYRYYMNTYENSYLYKIKKDGTNKEKLADEVAIPLYIDNGYLYYKNYFSGESKKVLISESIFKDTYNHWASTTIELFVENGYIKGYEDKTFRPDNSITRAEFVTIVNSIFNLTKSSGKTFNDTKTHWAKKAIDIAYTNGVCNGVSETEFKPDEFITREQAAVMISNYKKLKDTNYDKLNTYKDKLNVSSWAKDSVEGVIENGYMKGYTDNTFKPKDNITRAEAVVTLSRIK